MARPPQVLEDRTPLDGDRVDVAARIGWLLRTSRESAGLTLADMALQLREADLSLSASTLSRLERGHWRRSDVTGAYESILGLEPGRLRGAIHILCRTFAYGPEDEAPGPSGLAAYDAAVRGIRSGPPTGQDWWALARTHDPDQQFGLPTDDLAPLVATLTSELARAVGTAFTTRYEALARLRCGKYGHLVAETAVAFLREPGVQLAADVASCVSERPSASLLRWGVELLDHPADNSSRAGSTIVENIANAGTLPLADWEPVPAGFATAYDRACEAGDEARRLRLDRTYASLPRRVRDAVRRSAREAPRPVRSPVSWHRLRSNRHLAIADDLARGVASAAGHPVMARLLFEMLYDPRPARALNAALLVSASPYAEQVIALLVDAAEAHDDAMTREGAAAALCPTLRADSTPAVTGWLSHDDAGLRTTALLAAGMTGTSLPTEALRKAARDRDLTRWTVWYAGMSAPSLLTDMQALGLRASERPAVGWWLRHGPRVVV